LEVACIMRININLYKTHAMDHNITNAFIATGMQHLVKNLCITLMLSYS